MALPIRPIPRRRMVWTNHCQSGGLPPNIQKLFENPIFTYKPRRYVPVSNPELYFADLERNGNDTTELRKLQDEAEARYPQEVHEPKKKYNVPDDPTHVPVRIDVTKNGRVKVRICHEMATLYEKFYSKAIKPKIEEQIKALKSFGYPDEVLLQVLEVDQKHKRDGPILDEFINSIFGEFSDKRPAAPKKKNLYQVMKIKKPVYAIPDAPDEENEISDEEGIYLAVAAED